MALCCVTASLSAAGWTVGTITFNGNSHFDKAGLIDEMHLGEGDNYAEWMTADAHDMLLALYKRNGFLNVRIDEFEKNISIDEQKVNLVVNIDEGTQTLLNSIDVSGNTVFNSSDLLDLENIDTGKPLDGFRLENLISRIITRYRNHGYLYVQVEDRFYYTESDSLAELYLDITEGVQVRAGKITIKGNDKVKTSVISSGLEIKSGEILTEDKVTRSKNNLYRIGVFRTVRHELIGLEEQKEVLDVVITVEEGEFRTFGLGGGIGDVDGLRASVEAGHHNLFNRALALYALTQGTYQVFEEQPAYKYSSSNSLTLRKPYFLRARIDASSSLLFEQYKYTNHEEQILGANVLLRNMVTTLREYSLLFEINQRNIYNVDTVSADQSVLDNRGRRVTNLISPQAMFDERDDRFNPERGYMLFLRASLAGGPFLLGSINYYQFSVETSWLYPLIKKKYQPSPLVAALRIKTGIIKEFGGTASVPPSVAFNIGGSKSLRGYSETSIGPLNDRDLPGNYLFLTNFELRGMIWGNFGAVAFMDAGNVFRDIYFDSRFRLLVTAGLGLRYRTPVGPVRIDVGFKVNDFPASQLEGAGDVLKKESESWGRIHFGIGNSF